MTSTLKTDKIEGVTSSGTVAMPAGHVIQTVTAKSTTETSFNSTSWVSSGLFVNITPKFSTSKILISFSAAMYIAGEAEYSIVSVFRESGTATAAQAISGTDLATDASVASGSWGFGFLHDDTSDNSTAAIGGTITCAGVLDAPATTSQLRYTVGCRNYDTATNYFSANTARSTLVAQEIAQ